MSLTIIKIRIFQETEILVFPSNHLLRKFPCRLSPTTAMPYFNIRRHHLSPLSPHPFTRPAWCLCRHIQPLSCAPLFHLCLMNWRFPLGRRWVFWLGTRMDGLYVWTFGESRGWCRMSVWRKAWGCCFLLPVVIIGIRKVVRGYPVWGKPSGMAVNLRNYYFFLDFWRKKKKDFFIHHFNDFPFLHFFFTSPNTILFFFFHGSKLHSFIGHFFPPILSHDRFYIVETVTILVTWWKFGPCCGLLCTIML